MGAIGKPLEIQITKKPEPVPNEELHVYTANFEPGGHSKWHSHPGLELAVHMGDANSPDVTFYILNPDGISCRRVELQPGQSLAVLPGETHMAINENKTVDATIVVERLHPGIGNSIPVTRSESQPPAGTCPSI